jgi:peptidyl-prolyl cis-trans isomerase SurA
MKENAVSDPVETPFGIHIVQLLERRGESVHARHILFRIPEDTTATLETIALLNRLKDSIQSGASFYDFAKRYSDDKETGPVGGYIGRYPITQLDPSVLETIKGMKEGEISAPVQVAQGSAKGYHIVLLKRRIPEHAINLADDGTRLEQLTMNNKRNTLYQEWIQQLRGELYWDVRL